MAEQSQRDEGARDLLAAQYVLGVLDYGERAEARQLAAADSEFAALVSAWEERLAPMAEAYEPVPAPAGSKAAIEARLFPGEKVRAGFWQSLGLWRAIAAMACLALVVSLGFNLARFAPGDEGGGRLVVSLQPADGSPVSFVALYQPAQGAMRLSPVSGEAGAGRDFELWLIEDDAAPVSLGVLPREGTAEIALTPALAQRFREGTTLAISLEPEGGSPTGTATGPVVAIGRANPI